MSMYDVEGYPASRPYLRYGEIVTKNGRVVRDRGMVSIEYHFAPEQRAYFSIPFDVLRGGRPVDHPKHGRAVVFPVPSCGHASHEFHLGIKIEGVAELIEIAEREAASIAEARRRDEERFAASLKPDRTWNMQHGDVVRRDGVVTITYIATPEVKEAHGLLWCVLTNGFVGVDPISGKFVEFAERVTTEVDGRKRVVAARYKVDELPGLADLVGLVERLIKGDDDPDPTTPEGRCRPDLSDEIDSLLKNFAGYVQAVAETFDITPEDVMIRVFSRAIVRSEGP